MYDSYHHFMILFHRHRYRIVYSIELDKEIVTICLDKSGHKFERMALKSLTILRRLVVLKYNPYL